VTPGRSLSSTWACNTQRRRNSAPKPTVGADRLAGGIHGLILIEVIEHHLHCTLVLLDRVVLRQ
jgi:hypothetical protein